MSDVSSAAAATLDALTAAPPDRLDAAFDALAAELWPEGAASEHAEALVPRLLDCLRDAPADRRGHLVILLGLLAGAEYPAEDGPLNAAVRAGMQDYLRLLAAAGDDVPLTLALLYLLGHFPADRARIRSVTSGLRLAESDRTRLARSLQRLDAEAPSLGRVWPAPSVWTLDDYELENDRLVIQRLSPAQVRTNWENDTRTVRGYAGAKAYWAVRHGAPATVPGPGVLYIPAPPARSDARYGPLGRHLALLRCPVCRAGLQLGAAEARCTGCSTRYPIANGILSLVSGATDADVAHQATADLLQRLADIPTMGLYYESLLRPAFLRIAGGNWGGAVTPEDEDRFIAEHLRGVDGPVVDLAAGAGRWTEVVAATVGADRVVALDLALPLLNVLRRRLAGVPAVQASALDLPFADAGLAAVNCWNALHELPDAAAALAEIGRVLRPGGLLTLMTYRFATDPIARYFQEAHALPGRPDGMQLFEPEELRGWLKAAGLAVVHESGPELFMFVVAQRVPADGDTVRESPATVAAA